MTLPENVLYKIVKEHALNVGYPNFLNVCSANNDLKNICDNDYLWFELYKHYFDDNVNYSNEIWKEKFINRYWFSMYNDEDYDDMFLIDRYNETEYKYITASEYIYNVKLIEIRNKNIENTEQTIYIGKLNNQYIVVNTIKLNFLKYGCFILLINFFNNKEEAYDDYIQDQDYDLYSDTLLLNKIYYDILIKYSIKLRYPYFLNLANFDQFADNMLWFEIYQNYIRTQNTRAQNYDQYMNYKDEYLNVIWNNQDYMLTGPTEIYKGYEERYNNRYIMLLDMDSLLNNIYDESSDLLFLDDNYDFPIDAFFDKTKLIKAETKQFKEQMVLLLKFQDEFVVINSVGTSDLFSGDGPLCFYINVYPDEETAVNKYLEYLNLDLKTEEFNNFFSNLIIINE